MNPRRLYRSPDDRWIGGVAGGVAEYFDVDPVLVRVIWLISIPFTGGLSALAYLIMLIAVPEGPGEWPQPAPWQPGGAPIGYGAAYTSPAGPADTSAAGSPQTGTGAPVTNPEPTQPDAFGAPPTGSAPAANQVPPAQGWDWRWGSPDRWQRRAERWQRRADRWERRADRRNSGGLVFGVLLILIGGLIAWQQVNPSLDLGFAWPIAAIVFGAFLVVSSLGPRGGE